MTVSNVHIMYVGATAYDLRKIVYWWTDDADVTLVRVRFFDQLATVSFVKTTFEAAKLASLTAE